MDAGCPREGKDDVAGAPSEGADVVVEAGVAPRDGKEGCVAEAAEGILNMEGACVLGAAPAAGAAVPNKEGLGAVPAADAGVVDSAGFELKRLLLVVEGAAPKVGLGVVDAAPAPPKRPPAGG